MMRIVLACARRPLRVLFFTALVASASFLYQRKLPRDALPDLSDPQIVLVAEWMGHPADDVAARVTDSLTRALSDVPGATAVRGASMAGMSYVDVVFGSVDQATNGRTEIAARVARLRSELPAEVRVRVGPAASSTGWVFQYALMPPKSDAMPMAEKAHQDTADVLAPLREFQDTVLRPQLEKVPGVAEVATVGGYPKEVRVETTAGQLRGANVALSDVIEAVRSRVRAEPGATPESLASAVSVAGAPTEATVPLTRVADVVTGLAMPDGVADVDGATPAVGGIVIARRDADVSATLAGVRHVLDEARARLPHGVKLGVVYDRSELAQRVEHTLLRAVAEEVGVVALIVLLFLLHGRSALVPVLTLPLVVLLAFAAMRLLGMPATVMSLGGIAIALGLAVDAELVAIEACHRSVEADSAASRGSDRRARLAAAAATFAPPILISLLIAACAFVPVFAFSGETGRLLRPLALTKTVVIVAAALVALLVAPALRDLLLRGRVVPELRNPLTRGLLRVYRPFVGFALARPWFTLATAFLAVLSCVPLVSRLGSEFLPRIDEGDILYMPTTAPGIPMNQAVLELNRQDLDLASRPEVALVFGKIGRAETATDPASFSMAETMIRLKPRSSWPKVDRVRWYSSWAPPRLARVLRLLWPDRTTETTAELVAELDRVTRFPGWTNAFTAPVRARMDMMATGVRTAVGLRIVARDPARLDQLGRAAETALARVDGTTSASYESLGGETQLTFEPDEAAMAHFDVDPALVRSTAAVLTSDGQLGELRGQRVRLALAAPWAGMGPDDLLRGATVRAGKDHRGQAVPLGLLGRPVFRNVPAVVRSEQGERCAYVHVDVASGSDLSGYVARARAELDHALPGSELALRPGERLEWTGQYPLLVSGERRLALVAPLVALCMIALLLLQFRSLAKALIILTAVPFALVGSFWTLYLLDYRLSAPVWVGLLSVVGLAMQTGVLMIVYLDDAFARRQKEGRMRDEDDLIAAHAEGTVRRLRPKLMTIVTMGASLLPLVWAEGAGSEVMRRIAAPMIGGLLTSAFLTLEVLPVLYTLWRRRQLRATLAPTVAEAAYPSEARADQDEELHGEGIAE
jgi:Cu(I)/Ag(I) efflux system membrane protein CusA/SilA